LLLVFVMLLLLFREFVLLEGALLDLNILLFRKGKENVNGGEIGLLKGGQDPFFLHKG